VPVGRRYILEESSSLALARIRRVPIEQRVAVLGAQLLLYRNLRAPVCANAAHVVQVAWRQYLARKRQAAAAAGAGGVQRDTAAAGEQAA
jgi:hypothetical protein